MHQTPKIYTQRCHNTNSDIHLALLQIRVRPLGPELPSPARLLFNHPTRGIMPIINRILLSMDDDDEYHEALVEKQTKNDKKYDSARNYSIISTRSTVAIQKEGSDR